MRRTVLFVSSDPRELRAFRDGLEELRPKWRLEIAADGPNAMAWIKELALDAVVVDLLAPGYDALAILQDVAERRPEALRVGLTSPSQKQTLQNVAAPVHQFLCKPWDSKVLTAVLARAFAAQDYSTNQCFHRLLAGLHSLPVLPDTYIELERELRSEDPSLERAGEIVSQDMAVTAKLLQLVNSAYFGLGRAISSPTEAAMYLGTETLKALVLSLQVFSQYEHLRDLGLEALWKHSWLTGTLARQICEFEEAQADLKSHAFIGGLLHDLGKLVIAANHPNTYRAALDLAHRRGISFWEAEQELYHTSHAELGAYLLARWGLPAPVVEAVAFHHRPGLARDTGFTPLSAVHAANVFTKERVRGSDAVAQPVDVDYLQGIGLVDRVEQWQELGMDSALEVA
ncbi:MAG TPA: response regulator [Methylomirabilota bacterium]|nr:response regulator [Methylomirabilota bacterium]